MCPQVEFTQETIAELVTASRQLDSWLAEGRPLADADAALQLNQMKIGDWFAFGQERFGKKRAYDEALKVFPRYKRPTLKDFAHVARCVPALVRTNDLSFAHHKLVARFLNNSQYQKQLLNHAAENGLSKEAFSKYIKELNPPAKPKKPTPATVPIDADQHEAIEALTKKYNLPFRAVVRHLFTLAFDIENSLEQLEVA